MAEIDVEKIKEAENAVRDKQFFELYHPETGLPYGGLQENFEAQGLILYGSCEHQTWSATGFVSMLLYGIAGLRHIKGHLDFKPYLPSIIDYIKIEGIHYADTVMDIMIEGKGYDISRIEVEERSCNSINETI